MKKIALLIYCTLILSGCTLYEKKRLSGTVAEYNGATLTVEDIRRLTIGMSAGDSARVAEQYIHQWAIAQIEYDIAKDKSDKEIEAMVEDYRRSLYLHKYEERLIAQRMSQTVEDSIIQLFYEENGVQFILRETIVKGVLLITPLGAPHMKELRKKIEQPTLEENIEWVEKYAYQYSTGYELFLDEWQPISEITLRMPFEKDDLSQRLQQSRQIELQDSVNTYLLQVIDVFTPGQLMPIEYARPEIEKMILRYRQVEFIEREREQLYEKAVNIRKLKLYEK